MPSLKYSIIIPVYNRPEEVEELLESLAVQTSQNFEVIIVEDGSATRCDYITALFRDRFPLRYFYQENRGPGPARNFGFTKAEGEYLVVFDSDCIIPPAYFQAVDQALEKDQPDAWGGPDAPHVDFTPVQRAMGYTMASILTTGGIRGGKKHIGWFQPRSFNMGLSRRVYEVTGGFRFERFAEDIELSIRMKQAGFKVALIPDAFVYHKRRTSFAQFFRQVSNFGKGRAHIGEVFPNEVKVTHWFPTVFSAGMLALLVLPFIDARIFFFALAGFVAYLSAIFLHSLIQNKNLLVAALSVPSAVLQLSGYGLGFFGEWIKGKFGRS
ncbi:MAG TPA: glycosyltransferase [Chryseosolibacter sp.]|nr:glycosyltransferase [Chryseosolibacter sp.]